MAPRARLSMPPGAIIGYRKNGLPIHMIAGGAPDGDEGGQGGEGQDGCAGNGGAGTGTQDGQNSGGTAAGGRDSGGSGSGGNGEAFDPAHTQRVIAAIRGDVRTEREKRKAGERDPPKSRKPKPCCRQHSTPTRATMTVWALYLPTNRLGGAATTLL